MILEIEQEYEIWLFEKVIKEFSLQYKFKEKFGFDIKLWDTMDENGKIIGMYWDTEEIIKELLAEREETYVITKKWDSVLQEEIWLIIELKELETGPQGDNES